MRGVNWQKGELVCKESEKVNLLVTDTKMTRSIAVNVRASIHDSLDLDSEAREESEK
jgi:hypothetical protein